MYHRDALMRMILQVTRTVAELAGQSRQGKHQEALQALEQMYDKLFRLNARLFRRLSADDLARLLRQSGADGGSALLAAALLCKQEGELQEAMNREEVSFACRVKALELMLTAYEAGAGEIARDDIDIRRELGELIARLKAYQLDGGVLKRLFDYCCAEHLYAEAEDWLFERLDAGDAGAIADGERFYRELLLLPDERLERGNLPRPEVEAGLAELQAVKARLGGGDPSFASVDESLAPGDERLPPGGERFATEDEPPVTDDGFPGEPFPTTGRTSGAERPGRGSGHG